MKTIRDTVQAAFAGLTGMITAPCAPSVNITPGHISVLVHCTGRTDGERMGEVDLTVNEIAAYCTWVEHFLTYDRPGEYGDVGSYHRRAVLNGVEWDVWCPLATTAAFPRELVAS